MFIKKIRSLASEWNKTEIEMEAVSRESLLYGMAVKRTPSDLKAAIENLGIKISRPASLWSGNFYLLHTLPRALLLGQAGAEPEDVGFANKTLTADQKTFLRQRIERQPNISPEHLLKKLMPTVRQWTYRGRFLYVADPMHAKETLSSDIEQDLICEALIVINKELGSVKGKTEDDIIKYLATCLRNRAKNYFNTVSPKIWRAYFSDQVEFTRTIEAEGERDDSLFSGEHDFDHDLKTLLDPISYKAVSLLIGNASVHEAKQFERYLNVKGLKFEGLSNPQLRQQIEGYLQRPIFNALKRNKALRDLIVSLP